MRLITKAHKAKERGAKGAESRWGKKTNAQSNGASIEQALDQAINKQCLTDSNQSQSQTFNHSSNDINEEDALFLARAQEIDNYQNHNIFGETEEQKKDLDEAYDVLCYAEDGSKKRLEITGSTEKPTIEQLEAFCKAHTKVFLMPYNVEKWWHHWEAQKWIDSNKRRIEWQSKITNMAEDPRFIIKEKPTTQKTGWTPKTIIQAQIEKEDSMVEVAKRFLLQEG